MSENLYEWGKLKLLSRFHYQRSEKKMFNFTWYQKPDKINRKLLCQHYNNGGLKMIDLKKVLS